MYLGLLTRPVHSSSVTSELKAGEKAGEEVEEEAEEETESGAELVYFFPFSSVDS